MMCGIAGFIGVSTNPKITHQIATKVFEKLEVRGQNASGFWGCEPGDDGSVIYHKEPIASSKIVQRDIWSKATAKMSLDLLVMHARKASQGALPSKNKNNHPFLSNDCSIALVHNGMLPEHFDLRRYYETNSDTDSEYLLRIFEWATVNTTPEEAQQAFPDIDWITASKVMGLKKIFGYIKEGAFAAAVAERLDDDGGRNLWLFRNSLRPLHIIDVRDPLGQIFFCSTPEIWRDALSEIPEARKFISRRWVIEMGKNEIWKLSTNNDDPVVKNSNCKKFDVVRSNVWRNVEDAKSPLPVIKSKSSFSVISILDEDEEVLNTKAPRVASTKARHKPPRNTWFPIRPNTKDIHDMSVDKHQSLREPFDDYELNPSDEYSDDILSGLDVNTDDADSPSTFDEFQTQKSDIVTLEKFCKEIDELGRDIQTVVENKLLEGSMSSSEFQEILEHLESNILELKGTLTIAKS